MAVSICQPPMQVGDTFEKIVQDAARDVVILLYSSVDCPPCDAMHVEFAELATRLKVSAASAYLLKEGEGGMSVDRWDSARGALEGRCKRRAQHPWPHPAPPVMPPPPSGGDTWFCSIAFVRP